MPLPPISQFRPVQHAIKVINEVYELDTDRGDAATLIDWREADDGLAINLEGTLLDAVQVANNATVHGALPRGYFLQPESSAVLRLVRV